MMRGSRFAARVQQQPVAVVVDITSTEELNEALEKAGDKLVVVDYSTSWCGPCKIIAPKFDEFSEQYQGVDFLKVHLAPIAAVGHPTPRYLSSCDRAPAFPSRICAPNRLTVALLRVNPVPRTGYGRQQPRRRQIDALPGRARAPFLPLRESPRPHPPEPPRITHPTRPSAPHDRARATQPAWGHRCPFVRPPPPPAPPVLCARARARVLTSPPNPPRDFSTHPSVEERKAD